MPLGNILNAMFSVKSQSDWSSPPKVKSIQYFLKCWQGILHGPRSVPGVAQNPCILPLSEFQRAVMEYMLEC